MSFQIGTRVGPYEILQPIGSGGMGEVYKARDVRLNRTVAIKVLRPRFAGSEEMKARFEREAQTIAGLNHPNICVLHDVGHHDDTEYLVMEYLEGQTLAQRIERGRLPFDEALKIAIQVADALDRAHQQKVVHRDLKPSNVMLTRTGAKLLDFGLAKLKHDAQAAVGLTAMATNAAPVTAQGVILGTLQYMAPEQLHGQEADARADIFAFGTTVYEMVTGKLAFKATSQAALIGAILHVETPSVSTIVPQAPLLFDQVMRKCLAKNPEDRWQTARDLSDALKWFSVGEHSAKQEGEKTNKTRTVLWVAVSAVLALAVLLSFAYSTRSIPSSNALEVRFPVTPPDGTIFSPAPADLSVSPDGRSVVFAALNSNGSQLLWIRQLDSPLARPLTATDDAFSPFWSPDSRQIAFFAQEKLKRIDVGGGGGNPQTICDSVPDGRGGTWNRDNVIVFARSLADPLYRVPATGGSPSPLTAVDQGRQESGHIWPEFLPDGHHFLYVAWSGQKDKRVVRADSLEGGEPVTVLNTDSNVAFAAPDHLLFTFGGKLMTQRFNVAKLTMIGEPLLVSEDVWSNPATGRAAFDVSGNGVLVYRNGVNFSTTQFLQYDRSGKVLGKLGLANSYSNPSLSADQTRLATELRDYQKNTRNIWILESNRTIASRFTFGNSDSSPVWVRGARQILFLAWNNRDNSYSISKRELGGDGKEETLFNAGQISELLDWSEAHQAVVFKTFNPKTKGDLWVLHLDQDKRAVPFMQTEFDEIHAQISPDQKWLAYSSDETGRYEVYVQRFPEPGDKRQVSNAGGRQPRWNPNGKELFYLAPDRTLMAVSVTTNPVFEVDRVTPLFPTGVYAPSVIRSRNNYVVGSNGDTFIINSVVDSRQPVNVVVGWNTK